MTAPQAIGFMYALQKLYPHINETETVLLEKIFEQITERLLKESEGD